MSLMPLPDSNGPDTNRFFAVDEVDEPNQLVEFLDVAKALPGIKAAKADILERLQPKRASVALDVDCGYGADVIELAKRMKPGGQAIGIDISETMLAEANQRAGAVDLDITFQKGDALALPFEDNAFDICRTETVLQHLADPQMAVTEMARVTRSGGRVAALEFDLGTLFIDHQPAPGLLRDALDTIGA